MSYLAVPTNAREILAGDWIVHPKFYEIVSRLVDTDRDFWTVRVREVVVVRKTDDARSRVIRVEVEFSFPDEGDATRLLTLDPEDEVVRLVR